MKSKLQKINFWFLVTLIAFIPFQALLSGIFEFHFGQSFFWFLHWYEPLLIVLLLITVVTNPKMERSLGIYTLTLLVIGIISTVLYQPSSRGVEGFRFTLVGILFFALAYLSNLTLVQKKILLKSYAVTATLLVLWSIVELFISGKYWITSGLLSPDLRWGHGWHFVGEYEQLASLLGGPNQLASYLIPFFFVSLYWSMDWYKSKKSYLWPTALSALVLAVIIFTFSRSALVGLFVGSLIMLFITSKNIWAKRATVSFAIIVIAVIAFLYQSGNAVITHGKSQTEHASAMTNGLLEIASRSTEDPIKFLVGAGLGSAGPLAIKYGEGLVSESWYLQLFLEIGLIGVVLWLFFIGFILLRLYEKKNYPLFLGLLSVSITALFLHTWADNPALTYTLFTILGISLNKGSTKWQEF